MCVCVCAAKVGSTRGLTMRAKVGEKARAGGRLRRTGLLRPVLNCPCDLRARAADEATGRLGEACVRDERHSRMSDGKEAATQSARSSGDLGEPAVRPAEREWTAGGAVGDVGGAVIRVAAEAEEADSVEAEGGSAVAGVAALVAWAGQVGEEEPESFRV